MIFVTKSVSWTSSPVCASMKASTHAPVSSFSTCMTCVNASEPSCFATNSSVAGCWLNLPESALSAFSIACSRVRDGVELGILAVAQVSTDPMRSKLAATYSA